MINLLVVFSLIGLFFVYEILLQTVAIFNPKALVPYTEKLQRKAVRRIFSTFGQWRAWKPRLEDRLEVEIPDRFILVANHQSLFDIPIVWDLLPERCHMRFVAKRELGTGIPFVSSLLRVQGHALISRRGDMVQAMKNLERFGRRSRLEGFCPVLFPEGTRSRNGELGPFHTAGFRRIIELDPLPVLVAAIEGGSWVSTVGALLKNLGRYTYTVRLVALLPAPHGKKEILATLAKSRELVEEALVDMRAASAATRA
ncbi:MAG TPA: lysophospholipid acyltransferase family protein [Rectinemataceae bacterium]|nr:lysophospholipid acyltransferase family protein [Rectinemataceae bacterium]